MTGATVSGITVANVVGNGRTIGYDSATSPELDGRTCTLTDGGALARPEARRRSRRTG